MTFVSLMLIYILLAQLRVYSILGTLLFPILSIPLAICFIKNKLVSGIDFLFNVTIITGIYLLTYHIESVLIYVVAVCIPAYAAAMFYKRNTPLPNMIMYVSVSVVTAFFIYLAAMKAIGIDYEMQFILWVDEIKAINLQVLETVMSMNGQQNALEQSIIKEVITRAMDIMKRIFPALILIFGVLLASIQVVLLNNLLRSKEMRKHGLRQLFNFRLSRITVFILLATLIIIESSKNISNIGVVVSMNVFVFLQLLLHIMGIISIAVMLKKSSIHQAVKVTGYVILFVFLITPSSILMIFGCLDTLFNFRKAEIIV